jgi:hypothetical protein
MGTPLTGFDIGISAASPATHDVAGFGALTFSAIDSCDIVSIELGGKVWTDITFDTLCNNGSVPLKGTPEIEKDNIVLAFDKSNYSAARALLQTAEASTSETVSVEVIFPDGTDRWYYEGQVFQYTPQLGGSSDFVKEVLVIQRTADGLVEDFA